MQLASIYAQLNCSDLTASLDWYATLFERDPDAQPMPGLAEWHHGRQAGFQLYQDERNAGHGTLTLIVEKVREEHERLTRASLSPGPVESADYTMIMQLKDPDGNLVVLAQPQG
jgi:predicted enzyme related to lactoylglutathione lyase